MLTPQLYGINFQFFFVAKKCNNNKRNVIFTIFSQILSDRLLLTALCGQKSNLSCGVKLELTTTYYL